MPANSVVSPGVYLVGAGPGDPGLLTLRAVELLAAADLVVYDQLVPKRLLAYAHADAERICVRDLPGQHPDKYPHIHKLLIERGQSGEVVVRLKGGDPLIFGRGGEEAEALRGANVPYQIVPGITAAMAAGSYLEIPLTHRRYASAVALVTGHELPNKPGNQLDWQALAHFPGTLAIYMGIARLPLIVAELLKHGKDPNTPCAIVERASTGEMRSISSVLTDLEQARRNGGLEAPGLILIGTAVEQRVEPSWFEKLPLFGRRVLITRPENQAAGMVRQLENLGAVPFVWPSLEIRPPAELAQLDSALHQLCDRQWDWLVFTSANGVRGLLSRLHELKRDARHLGGVKIATVGAKTAEALAEFHLQADLIPDSFISEALAEQLLPQVQGQRVLLAKGSRGRQILEQSLADNVATLGKVICYEQHDRVEPNGELLGALRRGEIGYVMLSSSNTAANWIRQLDSTILSRIQQGHIQIVVISPETGKAVEKAGLPVSAVADPYSADGMIAALVRLAAGEPQAI